MFFLPEFALKIQ